MWRRMLGFTIFILLLSACEKPEGPGGKGTIRGQVMVRTYDPGFRVLQSVQPAADQDVYIQYGGEETVSDDRTTSPDGWFEFRYLSKGNYRVFVYADDVNGGSEQVPVLKNVRVDAVHGIFNAGILYRPKED